ncbi:MAG: hypothetical protein IJG37_03620 [Synergistaceae bacterium]|nr:hypothetical protein [Synergistaceae bacterium]MBQ7168659.1 hypothetical protein [Synergistaceae bacterium]
MKSEKREYTAPELEVIEFDSEDVITTSGGSDTGGHYTTPRIPITSIY